MRFTMIIASITASVASTALAVGLIAGPDTDRAIATPPPAPAHIAATDLEHVQNLAPYAGWSTEAGRAQEPSDSRSDPGFPGPGVAGAADEAPAPTVGGYVSSAPGQALAPVGGGYVSSAPGEALAPMGSGYVSSPAGEALSPVSAG